MSALYTLHSAARFRSGLLVRTMSAARTIAKDTAREFHEAVTIYRVGKYGSLETIGTYAPVAHPTISDWYPKQSARALAEMGVI